jgi:hypothetical protein
MTFDRLDAEAHRSPEELERLRATILELSARPKRTASYWLRFVGQVLIGAGLTGIVLALLVHR